MSDDKLFRKIMAKAVKIEVVHDLLKEREEVNQCFIIQSEDMIYIYTNAGKPDDSGRTSS